MKNFEFKSNYNPQETMGRGEAMRQHSRTNSFRFKGSSQIFSHELSALSFGWDPDSSARTNSLGNSNK